MRQSKEVRFAPDHPTAAGHFPSHPIIPGVLVLDEAIRRAMPGPAAGGGLVVRAAKFHHSVRPGDAITVRWQVTASGVVKFECRLVDGDILVASGTLETGSA